MVVGSREEKIRHIIEMEDRIVKCQRCKNLSRCVRKPSLGKGELEPELMMVFEYDNHFTSNVNNVINLRNMVKRELNVDKIYHTFLTRCQPKACSTRDSLSCYSEARLLERDNRCMLNGRECEGIPVRPADEEIISCMPFILEEINILQPGYIMLFGFRVAEYMLKSWGVFEKNEDQFVQYINDRCIILSPEGENLTKGYCQQVRSQMRAPECS